MAQRDIISICLDDVGLDVLAAYVATRTGITSAFANQYTDGDAFPYAHMPNLFACAENGITFTQARMTPICSPTRASVISGLYPHKHGCGAIVRGGTSFQNNVTSNFIDLGNQDEPTIRTIAHTLKANGYTCLAVGKWHLYLNDPEDESNFDADEGLGGSGFLHPINVMGFDEWAGTPRNPQAEGGSGYESYRWYQWNRTAGLPNDLGVVTSPHLSERTMTEAATAWASAGTANPRFLWLALNVAHGPFDWPPNGGGDEHEFDAAAPSTQWFNTRIRAALEHWDHHLGDFFTSIGFDPTNPDADDPVIFIWGDNGTDQNSVNPLADSDGNSVGPGEIKYNAAHPGWSASWAGSTAFSGTNSDPLSVLPYDSEHLKGSVFEQGTRVPLIVCGNTSVVTRTDEFDDALIDSVDLFATFAELGEATNVRATGTVTITNQPDDASTLTIDDGYGTVATFEFDTNATVTDGNIMVQSSSDLGNTGVNLRNAINGSGLEVYATDNGSGVVTVTHKLVGIAGNVAFVTAGETTDWSASGMSGGRSLHTATDGVSFAAAFTSASTQLDEFRDYSYAAQQFAPNGLAQTRRTYVEAFIRVDGLNLWKRHVEQRDVNEPASIFFYNVGNPAPVAATGTITFDANVLAGDTITITDNILHDDAERPAGSEVSFVAGTDFAVGGTATDSLTNLVSAINSSALDISAGAPSGSPPVSALTHQTASYCNNDPITLSGSGVTGRVSVSGMSGGVAPDPLELCDLNSTVYVAANGTPAALAATVTKRDEVLGQVESPSVLSRAQISSAADQISQVAVL